MSPFPLLYLLEIVGLSAACVAADVLLKDASMARNPYLDPRFFAGCAVYALTGIGWVHVFQHVKLSSLGVVFSVSTVLLLALVGVVRYRETISTGEALGILLGVASLLLLARHSG
jgi:drug/metabolite transporter (DMT)-like permease